MIPIVQREYREVPIAVIDQPAYLMRPVVDNAAFRELCDDIRVNGIQVALIVERVGERFRLAAGMRRLTAAKTIGAETVPCDIREPGVLDAEAIKVLENDVRENANPADTAAYLMRLFTERCGEDVDQVCALVKRSRPYVEDRLILFAGDEAVFEALRAGQVRLGVALELNKITDAGYRAMYLNDAIRFGMTRDVAKDLRLRANRAVTAPEGAAAAAAEAIAEQINPESPANVCTVCGKSDHRERMRWIVVHEHCDLSFLQPMIANFRERLGQAVSGE